MTREEALQAVKAKMDYYESDKRLRVALETLIPELAESDDERIRKHLIKHFSNKSKEEWNGMPIKDILAYLEKQKEHRETCTKFLAKILKHSAEGFRNVLKKKGIDYIPTEAFWTNTARTFSEQECNEFYKWMDDMTMEIVTEETPEYKKGFKDGLDASKKEQNPAEWSEEDENAITTAIRACRYMTENFENSTKQYEDAIERLKSLRPSWKPSEEQMEALRTAIDLVRPLF